MNFRMHVKYVSRLLVSVNTTRLLIGTSNARYRHGDKRFKGRCGECNERVDYFAE